MAGRARWSALTLVVLVLAAAPKAAAATEYPRTVDEIAVALREDPILVQDVLGTGDAEGVHDVLTDLAEKVDVPVFVVLATVPEELRAAEHPAEQIAALLDTELGDGLYVVQLSEGIGWVGGFGTAATELDIGPGLAAGTRAEEIGPGEYPQATAALEAELVLRSAADPGQEISDSQLRGWIDSPRAFVPTESFDAADREAGRRVVTISAALAVLIAGLTLTRVAASHPIELRPRRRKASGAIGPDGQIDAGALGRVHRRFDVLPAEDLASPLASSAEEALTAADLVDSTGDDADAVGAWVLALTAEREIERIHSPRKRVYRPCTVDPRHGEASATIRLSGSSIDAPACTSCGIAPGEPLTVSTWRGDRPYLDTDSVWARTGFGALVDDLARQVITDRSDRR